MLSHWLRLLRIGTLFSPAADVVAGACLTGQPWSAELLRAALASVLVYAAGMVLNDHADRDEDAVQRPERPIPCGAIAPRVALIAGFGLLLVAVAVSPIRLWHAGLAAGVLAYDYLLKRRAGTAVLTMAALRGANLLTGAALSASVWTAPPVVHGVAVGYAAYIAAVTVLGRYEDEKNVRPRAVVGVQTIPPLVTVAVLLSLPAPWPALPIGAVLALLFAMSVRRVGDRWDRAAIRQSMTWLLLGTMLFTALVCLGSGRAIEAAGIAAVIPIARIVSRRVALT